MSDTFLSILSIIIGVLFLCLIALIYNSSYNDGYKKGQADAISGKIKYKLVEFEDGTRDYYKETELKELLPHKIV